MYIAHILIYSILYGFISSVKRVSRVIGFRHMKTRTRAFRANRGLEQNEDFKCEIEWKKNKTDKSP